MSSELDENITKKSDTENPISAEKTKSGAQSGLTPRQLKKRISSIAAMENPKTAKSQRKRLIWKVMRAIADGSATPARRFAQILVEAYPPKIAGSSVDRDGSSED